MRPYDRWHQILDVPPEKKTFNNRRHTRKHILMKLRITWFIKHTTTFCNKKVRYIPFKQRITRFYKKHKHIWENLESHDSKDKIWLHLETYTILQSENQFAAKHNHWLNKESHDPAISQNISHYIERNRQGCNNVQNFLDNKIC